MTTPQSPLSPDTPLAVERIWIDGLRRMGPARRMQRVFELSALVWKAAREAVLASHPAWTVEERDRFLLASHYGADLAARVMEQRSRNGFYR